jgi:hypothetical protein
MVVVKNVVLWDVILCCRTLVTYKLLTQEDPLQCQGKKGIVLLELYLRWKLKNILQLSHIVAYVVTASSLYILPILTLSHLPI